MLPDLTSMLSPAGWAALAIVPPALIALYFLKLRRHPLEVPSTYLWLKSIEDLRVNSLWQRLRQSLLLFLQLALVLLLMIALLRPSWLGQRAPGGRSIFLIDNSASMAATDVAPSRLAEAKRRVSELIESMDSGDVAMLVSFSNTAQVAQPFTNNRRELRRALAAIPQTDCPTDLTEALSVAAGMTREGRPSGEHDEPAATTAATLFIFSDGKFADVERASLGSIEPIFVPIGSSAARNVAVTALGTQRREEHPDQLQVFARVENFSPAAAAVDVTLHLQDELLDADHLDLDPGGSGGVAFDLGTLTSGVLEVRLKTADAGRSDMLAADDRAWTTLDPPQPMQVLLVTPGNEPLSIGLQTGRARQAVRLRTEPPAFLNSDEYVRAAGAGVWDLVIYDRCQPSRAPQANTFTIASLPPGDGWSNQPEVTAPQILDADTAHPLMHTVNLGDVLIAAATPLVLPRGGQVLVDTTRGPLMAIAPREQFEDLVLACPIIAAEGIGTNWPVRLSWPVFLWNLVEYFGGQHAAMDRAAVRPGQLVELRVDTPAERIEVVPPEGAAVGVERGAQNVFAFSGAERVGVYDIRAQGQPAGRFAINLVDRAESDISPRSDGEIQIGPAKIAGQSGWETVRRDMWKWLVLGALAILLVEWYIYNRRVYV